jgi:hypothetical protein
MPGTGLTDEALREFSNGLLFEVQVFFRTIRRIGALKPLPGRPAPSTPWEVRVALIESFVVRARALHDFLYRDKRRQEDDALAADFFERGYWTRIRPPEAGAIAEARTRINKEIAHLTYKPGGPPSIEEPWVITRLATGIGTPLRVFIESVPPSRVSEGFTESALQELPVSVRASRAGRSLVPVWTSAARTRDTPPE